jgi:hypothetical protein
MAMNKARRTANLNNILTYDTLGNSTLIANLTVEGLTGAGFVKADANGLLSVDTAAYTVVTGATNYLTKITAPNTLGQSLVYDNGTSVYVNSTTGVTGYNHSFTVVANSAGGMVVSTTNTASAIGIVNSASGNKTWDISPFNNTLVINESGLATRMVFHPGGNITIGDITTTGHKLEIVGSFRTTGNNTLSQLGGVGTRMVVVDTNGLLSTQAIATGSVTGTGAAGQVAFWTGTSVQSGSNNFFWDNTNGRLGIGTNAPAYDVELQRNKNSGTIHRITNTNNNASAYAAFELTTTSFASMFKHPTARTYKFILGDDLGFYNSTAGDISILNDFATGNIKFGAGGSSTAHMTLHNTGNLLLGSTSNSGERLQVTGNVKITGGGTGATNGLLITNSAASSLLAVRNDGLVLIGASASRVYFMPVNALNTSLINGTALQLQIYNTNARTTTGFDFVIHSTQSDYTSGSVDVTRIVSTFAPTSGNGVINSLTLTPTINQVGATGITRGLYVNPTLTAAADFRAIETTNGKVIFGNLPTSSAGLPTGAIWNDAGTIKIV